MQRTIAQSQNVTSVKEQGFSSRIQHDTWGAKPGRRHRQGKRKKPTRSLPPLYPEAVADYESGVPIRKILRKYGYCDSSFYKLLDMHKLPRRKRSTKPLPANIPVEAFAEYTQHIGVRKILKKYNICMSSFYRLLDINGIPRINALPMENKLARRIHYHRSAGYNYTQIKRNLRISNMKLFTARDNYCLRTGALIKKEGELA